jgi:pSer/pThr/pTyr-binding forkhead associated (FHA) protein
VYNSGAYGKVQINREESRMDANLVLFKKDGTQQAFSLPSDTTVIGRRHDCDLCVPLMVVSRRHCQLIQNNESIKVRDLESRGGTFLNGRRVDEATLKPGDYIRIGPLTFLLQIDGEPEKIIPPKQAQPKPAPKTAPQKAPAEVPSGSFPELELDESDSFMAELEDL